MTMTAGLLLIRDAFQTVWEYLPVDANAHDGDRPQDLYKACEALSGALEAITPPIPSLACPPKVHLSDHATH